MRMDKSPQRLPPPPPITHSAKFIEKNSILINFGQNLRKISIFPKSLKTFDLVKFSEISI